MADDDVIVRFWRGIDEHDWDLLASTIADNFERHGMFGTEADTCRGKANYLRFVSGVIGRMEHHTLKARKIFRSADGRQAVAECIETIRTEGVAMGTDKAAAALAHAKEQIAGLKLAA